MDSVTYRGVTDLSCIHSIGRRANSNSRTGRIYEMSPDNYRETFHRSGYRHERLRRTQVSTPNTDFINFNHPNNPALKSCLLLPFILLFLSCGNNTGSMTGAYRMVSQYGSSQSMDTANTNP